ncbi:MAG: SMP-30/gluconolactonase/LRE family protein [Chitinophagaceae bacterium]|nr:SMP-30/gluconolactonase/LRE family protein [Chitinophagaceae bacterium]
MTTGHSKKHLSFFFSFVIITISCHHKISSQASEVLFQSTDFTAENLFSANIEGPAFDSKGNLFVVNYGKDGTIGKVNSDGSCELYVTLPEGSIANAIKFNRNGDMLLADFPKHNVLKVDKQTKQVTVFCHNDSFSQPNDLCINRQDQLFASDPNWKKGTGQLWRIDPDGKSILLEGNMGTVNGIELSPDETILYVNETGAGGRKIWKYAVDPAGNISNKTRFADFNDFGFDGMKCDRQGNLYICRYGKGVIAVLSPQGKLIREVPLKGKSCSNLVFGGKEGRSVYITLQDRKGMETFRNDIPGKSY